MRPKSYGYLDVEIIELLRFDGAIPSKVNGNWEIEDFIPPKLLFQIINKILRKEKYTITTPQQLSDRTQLAHQDKQILKYAEECCNHRSPDKPPFSLDNEGRKKQICQYFYNEISDDELLKQLNLPQKKFLKNIVS